MARPVTRAALSKYERGEMVPRADVLVDLSRVLELPPSHFLAGPPAGEVEIRWLHHRGHARPGARQQDRIQARCEVLAEAYLRLADQLEPGARPTPVDRRPARTLDQAESAAAELRQGWNLGDGPLLDLVARAEDAGILVLGWDDEGRFDALSGWIEGGRAIVVLDLHHAADRRRFHLAHELGHLTLDTAALPPADEERLAHRFACALLVPAAAARRELGVRRASLARAELEHLERKYGLSMQAWTHRARDLGIVTEETYRTWQTWFRSRAQRVRESAEYGAREAPSRLHLLFLRALAERLVDREWARALCPEAVTDLEVDESHGPLALLRAPAETRRGALERAADAAAEDYASDPETEAFLGFHEDPEEG